MKEYTTIYDRTAFEKARAYYYADVKNRVYYPPTRFMTIGNYSEQELTLFRLQGKEVMSGIFTNQNYNTV